VAGSRERPGKGLTVREHVPVTNPDSADELPREGGTLEQRKTDAEVALELMRMVLDQAGSRRLSPTRTLALYHLCKEAVAYAPEGPVSAAYLEDELKKLLQ
jgi:hypothetical protein